MLEMLENAGRIFQHQKARNGAEIWAKIANVGKLERYGRIQDSFRFL